MTKENLLKYLRDPSYLNHISYQELKTLVAEHPSSLSLRYLLALKSKQENNGDYQRQLEFLATYSTDRAHLFTVLNRSELEEVLPEGVVLQEDYLELKELSALERDLGAITTLGATAVAIDAVVPKSQKQPTAVAIAEPNKEEYYTFDFNEEMTSTETEVLPEKSKEQIQGNLSEIESLFQDIDEPNISPIEEEIPAIDAARLDAQKASEVGASSSTSPAIVDLSATDAVNLDLQETLKGGEFPDIPLEVLDTDVDVIGETAPAVNAAADNNIVPLIEEDGLEINPVPKTSFTTWFKGEKSSDYFNGFDLVGYNSKGLIEELIQEKVTPASGHQHIESDENLNMGQDIASETLAQLLIEQGHYQKAKMMYEQLKLIYPEKNSFFAGEIERVENLEASNAFNG